MLVDILALIGLVTVLIFGVIAFRFFSFRSRVISNLILKGFTRDQAKNIYAASSDRIHALHFQGDITPQAFSEVLSESFSYLFEERETLQEGRACPYCAEEVSAAAKKCKHCSSEIEPIIAHCSYCDTVVRSPIEPCDRYSTEELKKMHGRIKNEKCLKIFDQKFNVVN